MMSHRLFEELYNKLDRQLGQAFLLWHDNQAPTMDPSPISLFAWLKVVTKNGQTSYRARQRLARFSGRTGTDTQFAAHAQLQEEFIMDRPPSPLTDDVGAATFAAFVKTSGCPFDGQNHKIITCDKFKSASPAERRRTLAKDDRCFGCLEKGHKIPKCTKGVTCSLCPRSHHTLLHMPPKSAGKPVVFEAVVEDEGDASDDSTASQIVLHAATGGNSRQKISLHTVPVLCINPANKKKHEINCMLDSGASATFISARAAKVLGLTGYSHVINLKGVEGLTRRITVTTAQVNLQVQEKQYKLFVQISEDPAASYQPVDWSRLKSRFPHLRHLPLPPPVPGQPVDMLLGQDAAHLMAAEEPDVGTENAAGPVARKSLLGWSVGGPTQTRTTKEDQESFFLFRAAIAQPQHLEVEGDEGGWQACRLRQESARKVRFREEESDAALTAAVLRRLDEEEAPDADTLSFTDQLVFRRLQKEMKMKEGRYEVPVLWKKFPPPLPNNYTYALARLVALEKCKAFRAADIKNQYMGQLEEWVKSSFVEPVISETPQADAAYYIPHMAVVNLNKVSSQVRIVMDAAAAPRGEQSLNAHVHKGPKLINELVEVLLRFRRDRIAVAADIEKMFHRITMPVQDRDFHRFLWREAPDQPIKIFRWISHVFGNSGSPCVAITTVKTHAGRHKLEFPKAADTLIHSTLVDDSLDSVPSVQDARELLQQLRVLLQKMGMNIKKVVSSSSEVMREVPPGERSPSLHLQEFETDETGMPLVKTLGVIYIASTDEYSFTLQLPEKEMRWTKRNLLRFEARLYDPHGLILPHTVAARILLQRAWRAGLAWDDLLPSSLLQEWEEWLDSLKILPTIRIPRAVFPTDAPPIKEQQLHVFSDASDEACAAAIYMVTHFKDNSRPPSSRLVLAKAKVAPLKKLTIPRLELVAASLSVSLLQCVASTYSIPLAQCHCWVDSVNVLCWIRNDSRALSTFVGNRVAKIQRATSPQQWKFVDSARNAADIPSRGVLASGFHDNDLWWSGPDFLKDMTLAPEMPSVVDAPQASQELKKGTQFAFINTSNKPHIDPPDDGYKPQEDELAYLFIQFSSFNRLVRVVAWCLRWRYRVPQDHLLPQELREARRRIWISVQKNSFKRTLRDLEKEGNTSRFSVLRKLHPEVFPDGLLRIKGRLQALPVDFESRHPIILPKHHPAVLLLADTTHRELLHVGTEALLAHLTQKYWIVQGRRLARHTTSACVVCRRQRPQAIKQKMADLPLSRYPEEGHKVFERVGIDMAGPYFINNKPDKFIHKRYFVLFTCLTSRAVHLEPLQSASAPSFLAAFERFTARRNGVPTYVVCDNGSNFVAAAKELKNLLKNTEGRQQIRDKHPETEWDFIPPTGSHYGGVYERLIAAVKRSLRAALPPEAPTSDEFFHTALTVVEGILNSRPLTYVSQDAADPRPLRPADALGASPYRMLAEEPQEWSLRKLWHSNQLRLDQFWARFKKEVLPFFQVTTKWHLQGRAVQDGDVVTMLDDQCRGLWPLAVVEETETSHDGLVRTVTIRYRAGGKNRTCRRPVSSLCLLLPAGQ